jgi:hypothetical protein
MVSGDTPASRPATVPRARLRRSTISAPVGRYSRRSRAAISTQGSARRLATVPGRLELLSSPAAPSARRRARHFRTVRSLMPKARPPSPPPSPPARSGGPSGLARAASCVRACGGCPSGLRAKGGGGMAPTSLPDPGRVNNAFGNDTWTARADSHAGATPGTCRESPALRGRYSVGATLLPLARRLFTGKRRVLFLTVLGTDHGMCL